MKHFVHFLNREIKTRVTQSENLFYQTEQREEDGFDRPMYHMTRGKVGPVSRIEIGSVIWVFSYLKSPWGVLPPSLDGKFVVKRIEKLSDGRTKFHASEDSSWFMLSDARSILKVLKTINGNEEIFPLWRNISQPIGYYIQSIRQLYNGEELVDYSTKLLSKEYDFISYRIKDGTKRAFLKALELMENGGQVFWDRYCLPRRLAERRELVSDDKLDDYLINILRNSSRIFGIESKLYSEEGSYSYKEAELGKALKKFIAVPK